MSSDNLTSLVPVIYYDLIARVASGSPFALIITALMDVEVWEHDFLFVVMIFGGGYLLGTLLSTLSAAINLALWNTWAIRVTNKMLHLKFQLPGGPVRAFSEVYERIDRVTSLSRYEGSVLEKMEAGAACVDNLFSGVLILFCLEMADRISLMSPVWFVVLLLFLLVTMILRRILLIGRLDKVYARLVGVEIEAKQAEGVPVR